MTQALRGPLGRLALIEASRLEEEGDFEGALDCYLALLRCSRHCGQRAFFIGRLIGMALHNRTAGRLTRWAAEPRVDARLLRRALDAAIAAGAATPPISESLKAEYLSFLHSIADPDLMARLLDYEVVDNDKGGSVTLFGRRPWKSNLARVHRRAIAEPERSRRVLRLIFANWRAYADLPPERRPPWALTTMGPMPEGHAKELLADLFVVGDDAPAAARALPPAQVARWYATTVDAREFLPAFANVERALGRERSTHAALLVALANELYKCEHGGYPARVEDLIGPYLESLPPGYLPSK